MNLPYVLYTLIREVSEVTMKFVEFMSLRNNCIYVTSAIPLCIPSVLSNNIYLCFTNIFDVIQKCVLL